MKEKYLFLNIYYFNISEEKGRNRAILDHFLYNTDYDDFNINSYVIALSIFTDYRNFRNDIINLEEHVLLNNILADFFNGNNNQYNISRIELEHIVDLCNDYRLSKEDNEKIIKKYVVYFEEYQPYLDIMLNINNQI